MPLFSNIRKQFTQKQLGNSLGVVMRNYGKQPEFQPYRQVRGITYKAIDKIGLSMSVYEPLVKRPGGDFYTEHPVINLFNTPNPRSTGSDFVHLYSMLYQIYGETFWYKVRGENSNKVKELYLLAPDKVELKFDGGELIGYVLHKSSGEQVPFELDEIYHDKRPNPFNEWRGISVLERAAVYVDTEINISNFTMNYIANNASPSGIVSLPKMEGNAFKLFTQQWRENYEGPENAGKTAFIRGGEASFQAVGATLKDIELEKIHGMSKDDVLMMLEVPKPLLGMTDDKGFGRGNLEALYVIFANETLEPMMRRLDRIYEVIGSELVGGKPIDVTHESPVPEDKEFLHKQNVELVNVAMTVNEVRQRLGLDPLPGKDVLDTPQPAVKHTKVTLKKAAAPKLNDEQEAFRKKLVETNDKFAIEFKRKTARLLSAQESAIIDKISASHKAFEEWLFNIKEESEEFAAELLPLMILLMENQGEDVANFITGELLTISPEMRREVENHIKQISGVFNQDTITALEKTLTEGQTNGESLAKLKKRVEQVYDDAKGYRAERIARTETLRASNMTAEEVYKQNGYSSVEWFINPGACEFCRTYAGKTKAIGSKFNNIGDVVTGADGGMLKLDYDDLRYPPLHPQCTCSIVPAE